MEAEVQYSYGHMSGCGVKRLDHGLGGGWDLVDCELFFFEDARTREGRDSAETTGETPRAKSKGTGVGEDGQSGEA